MSGGGGRGGCAVEVATDPDGTVLWVERYGFSRAHAVGDRFDWPMGKGSKGYVVIAKRVTRGLLSDLVEHVVVPTTLTRGEVEAARRGFLQRMAGSEVRS